MPRPSDPLDPSDPSDPLDLLVAGPADVVAVLAGCGAGPLEVVLGLVLAEAVPGTHLVCGAAVRRPPGPEPGRPAVDAGQIADLATEMLVGAVVLARVDESTTPPARVDVRRFVGLRHHCAARGVSLLDHVLVGRSAWWSLRAEVLRSAG